MKIDQLLALRVFVRIAEARSFSRAADSLDMPRPTVTKLMQELEKHLGVKLLQRTTRRVTVTAEGAAYYERALHLLGEVEEMDALVARSHAQLRGRLRIDIGSSLANAILIPALPDFHARYPDIQIHLGVGDRPVDLIGEGVDCVIRSGVLADTSLVAKRIAEFDYVTCASPAYLTVHGVPAHPEQLAQGHGLITYFSSLTGKPNPLLFRRRRETFEIGHSAMLAVNESTARLTALLAGLGVSQTYEFLARPHIERGALVPLLREWTRPRHPVHLLYPSNRHVPEKLKVFADWAAGIFSQFDDRFFGSPRPSVVGHLQPSA
ncbi:LysR family transcriptional regulator [Paraburkholderia caballeronis]|uniref:DNA-binding transcriptional regulator, LysR family n=1 Tax=Paraburkholderia caballeronis TaxID=416943 RepID=A0A1H7SZR3_9BURK|nr:LysR family transcriptional regulator [Paraburkholderia caballeronis]PXW25737.1 LysR family transcriptional regulator [Paraburkholderia caballeronis]PXX01344.1 LysR family transcriptional regulator [Paraburkholderia caballeronis]RAJ99302.1 LysR family transcriptional regulator [Paraburkholderia caballeronis]SEE24611.1 transcriptional regulator, LysR family [Paraburkholderia caballeronis]SEL77546.1 DNA-binding transcriptional regulator, LysR family [Paraburkholderia caballeronis]